MKKKNLLSGIGAKLALAVVALTTVVFTSCEKEEFIVEPVEIPNASATIVVTVYDLSTGAVLSTQNETIAAGADGTIAATTKTYGAKQEGYLDGSVTVNVPALAKGQFAYIPANIYLQSELSAAKNPIIKEEEKKDITPEKPASTTVTNDSDVAKKMEVKYNAAVGQEITNITEVNQYIDGLATGRALSSTDVKTVLKAYIQSQNPGIGIKELSSTIMVPAFTQITLTPTTFMTSSINTITTTVDGVLYTIPNVIIKKAGATVIDQENTPIDHGHGHGNGGNAGGGGGTK